MSKKKIEPSEESPEELYYIYPKAEEIIINKANLQIKLDKFKDKIKNSFSLYDLLAIVALWSPIFTADFKDLFGISSTSIKVGYIIFALFITIIILWPRLSSIFSVDKTISSDPEEMAQKILEQCQKKK